MTSTVASDAATSAAIIAVTRSATGIAGMSTLYSGSVPEGDLGADGDHPVL